MHAHFCASDTGRLPPLVSAHTQAAVAVACMLLLSLPCEARRERFPQEIGVDPDTTWMLNTPFWDSVSAREEFRRFETALVHDLEIDPYEFYYVMFRYRDTLTLPLMWRLVEELSDGHLLKLWAISVVGQDGRRGDFGRLIQLFGSDNPLVREYVANALGKCGDSGCMDTVRALLRHERNGYVRATLRASLARLAAPPPRHFPYLPVYDTMTVRKLLFVYNDRVVSRPEWSVTYQRFDPAEHSFRAGRFVFPHQQYHHGLKHTRPPTNFGGASNHAGIDSGWFLEGLPVHCIGDGVVVCIHHDISWGCLVAVEHRLKRDRYVTSYYAHLSHDIDVVLGQDVRRGDKLGEIGPATTVENGGYWPHVHMGIEKARGHEARIEGYARDLEHWHNPLEFVPLGR